MPELLLLQAVAAFEPVGAARNRRQDGGGQGDDPTARDRSSADGKD